MARVRQPGKASDGGNGRKLDYRAIVERHFGKHTGLRHSAKACPEDLLAMETGCEAGVGEVQPIKRRQGARNRAGSDSGKQGQEARE
ncbi:hypothetical protein ACFIOY_12290 [Bradyrhizobium sp. TZ2]